MRVRYVRTLIFYDEPQVFEARDSIGGHYIAVLGVSDEYLVAGVAPARLRAFCDGKADLRSLVLESEAESRYLAPELPPDGVLVIGQFEGDLEGFLPAPDLVLDDLPSAELETGDGLRLELRLDVPDDGRIGTGLFTDLIHQVQMLTKHTLAQIRPQPAWRWRDGLLDVVVPAESGSFRVVLEASGNQVPAFHEDLVRALRRIDTLFQRSEDPSVVLAAARENRGRVAAEYMDLLRLLSRGGTGLRYSWTGGGVHEICGEGVSSDQARVLLGTLSDDPPRREAFTRDGELYRCNINSGHWGLRGPFDNLLGSGDLPGGSGKLLGWSRSPNCPDLGGLRVGGRYRFYCEADVGLVGIIPGSVVLTGYEPLSRAT